MEARMELRIFNVEHGACALLTCDNGATMMIDCGADPRTGWRPGKYLKSKGITALDMLAITNYDEAHVSGIEDLTRNIYVRRLWRNHRVSASAIKRLKRRNELGSGVDHLIWLIENVFTGSSSETAGALAQDAYFNTFSHSPTDFPDENNLSMVIELNCRGVGFFFPGDLQTEGWRAMLPWRPFQNALTKTEVLIAAHHGEQDGCCDEAFEYCKPRFVVISDKNRGYQSQDSDAYYSSRARGGAFRSDSGRRVIKTGSDGEIAFEFQADKYVVR
jgi:beta-lactamase superfamily II metal-dependent hydrolase